MLKLKDGHIQASPMPKELEDFISSSAKHSITRYINPLKLTYKNKYGDTENIVIVDTPGFGDS
jgi:translation elongation factor EF-4